MSSRAWRIGTALLAGAGLLAVISTAAIPWPGRNPLGFVLHPATLGAMGLSGVFILLLVGRLAGGSAAVRIAMLALGVSTLAYPCLLSLAAAGRGGTVLAGLAMSGHLLPLTMVNLLPILAVSAVTGRGRPVWAGAVVALPLATALMNTLAADSLSAVATVGWLANFVLPMIATWPLVRGTSGDVRRRAIVCGLASVVPVIIITFCMTLGLAEEPLRLGDLSVTALMLGFSACTLAAAGFARGATQSRQTTLLSRSAILRLLAASLAAVTLIAATGGGLAILALAGPPVALLAGVTLTAALGLGSVRLHRWAAQQIDPLAEVASELAALGDVSGQRRSAVQQALRKVTGDPGLLLLVLANDGVWVDPGGRSLDPPAEAVALTSGEPAALALGTAPETAARLSRLGDCRRLLAPAVLEASIEREAARADRAAAAERRRLSRDLHDGVQGHLLGIALNLQLSGARLEDPTARLLVDDTVRALRDAVEEVRSLGDGRTPSILVTDGLGAALSHLVQPLGTVSQISLPTRRHTAELEATAYFVVSEALANAVKHARAGHIRIAVTDEGEVLRVMVVDDGVGGADLRLGSGLRGITERVAASGGLLVVRDGLPTGTVVEASLPCGS